MAPAQVASHQSYPACKHCTAGLGVLGGGTAVREGQCGVRSSADGCDWQTVSEQ